jgi:hypothetical protein
MAKSQTKRKEVSIGAKRKASRRNLRTKREEYVENLMELHKLQGVLLTKLLAEV